MPTPKPIYGFASGEVAPDFYGRTDLTKFELGVATAKNFYVNYRGGLTFRGGSEFVAPLKGTTAVKLFKFGALYDDYVLIFGHLYLRFARSGGYLLEAAKTITALTAATTGVVTAVAHGYSTGDWIYLSGVVGPIELNQRHFEVGAVTTNTFQLLSTAGVAIDTSSFDAWASGGTVARVVTLTTPYTSDTLEGLKVTQRRSVEMRITSLDYPRYRLVYSDDVTWALTQIVTAASGDAPTNVSLTASGSGSAGMAFAVTAVVDDTETTASDYEIKTNSVDYSNTAGSLKVTWSSVDSAASYNIYRSLILPIGTDVTTAQELGYLGRAYGNRFTDTNITPDFTKSPPQFYDPFSEGAVLSVAVTDGGEGYTTGDSVSISDPTGEGFEGYSVANGSGVVTSVVVTNGGFGYTNTSVFFSGNGFFDDNAAGTATLGAASGNHPRAFAMFQQREVYAGTTISPMGLWATKPGTIDNFDISPIINAGDSYSFTFDGVEVDPIYHLLALRSGLLVFSSSQIALLRAEDGIAVSGINALAEPQAYKGVSSVEPILIDLDVLFVQRKSTALNAMIYTEYTNSFAMQDISVLSGHLFGEGRRILRMEWVAEPNKLLYSVKEDGSCTVTTYERAQEVFGFTQMWTAGLFKDLVALEEDGRDTFYTVVERNIDGEYVSYLERSHQRTAGLSEDFWGVDAGRRYTLATPAATLSFSGITGSITVTADSAVFSAGNVGDIIYANGGKLEVTAYTSTTIVTATILREFSELVPESTTRPLRAYNPLWEMGTPVQTLTNLWHLEGEAVSVLADGNVYLDQTVSGGSLILDIAATKITIGLPYTGLIKTLPVNLMQQVTEGQRKALKGVSTRVQNTRGLAVGAREDELIEFANRTDEDWGEAINPLDEVIYQHVNTGWDEDQQLFYKQVYPLPAEILSLVFDVDVGDDE
jgi:hypothetical protein